jgi:hypothetical protein
MAVLVDARRPAARLPLAREPDAQAGYPELVIREHAGD